ncbi:MAG: winged helix-turn-helix domain-containing protein, partial [Coriobacteriales bacterium]|jgi:ATP-dependent DNA helicase RecG|nr:winged helix-turn-helix domain-containing protein [Coriobacteriales bacterium]
VQQDKNLKSNDCTLNCTTTELEILDYLKEYPTATQQEIADAVGKSIKTIKNATSKLQTEGLLEREGAKKNGKWVVTEGSNDNGD